MSNLINKAIKFHKNRSLYSKDSENNKICFNSQFKSRVDFDKLFEFFEKHRSERLLLSKTRLYESHFTSANGNDMDSIEGVTRYLPYLATNILNMEEGKVKEEYISDFVCTISKGTDPNDKCYWGEPLDYDQLVCEAADIALAIWLLKDLTWNKFDSQARVLKWLYKCQSKKVSNNNWYLFLVIIQCVLNSLDSSYKVDQGIVKEVLSWEVGDGWFTDGKNGHVDYYTCWAIIYSLFWINIINPTLLCSEIKSVINRNSMSLRHLFDKDGQVPLYGRSVSYRLAVSVPVVANAYISDNEKEKGLAIDIINKSYSYYAKKGAFISGRITSGVFTDNIKYVDNYSGPSSSLWSLRSLIILEYGYYTGFFNPDCVVESYESIRKPKANKPYFLVQKDEREDSLAYVTIKNPNKNAIHEKFNLRNNLRNILLCILKLRMNRKVLHRENFDTYFESTNNFYR
ncbi:DUF2264 domain-containing protein [Vibrio campbellii]|uniref:DUF2264 domain-containing protein n=1 Tax=Vibrio campbellii TaxID=680 RepID=UPI0005EEF5FC|nr:DUF2264 domain-containing protein [Vibrio campbellii]